MKWHILTSSKGGAGKTITSLMLLRRKYLDFEKESNDGISDSKGILIIDVNGVNVDVKSLIPHEFPKDETIGSGIPLENSDQFNFRNLVFEYARVSEVDNVVLGWLNEPFYLFGPDEFVYFLKLVKEKITSIEELIPGKKIECVIIDTNYHFANIFPKSARKTDFEFLGTDSLYIWFIWMVKQIKSIIDIKSDFDKVIEIAKDLERCLMKVSEENGMPAKSPFVHVFTPVSLASAARIEGGNLLEEIISSIRGRKKKRVNVIPSLYDIYDRTIIKDDFVTFQTFKDWLEKSYRIVKEKKKHYRTTENKMSYTEEAEDIFSEIAKKVNNDLNGNIIPIPVFQKELDGYTNADSYDVRRAFVDGSFELPLFHYFTNLTEGKNF